MPIPAIAIGKGLTKALAFVVEHWRGILIGCLVGLVLYQNFSATRFLFGMDTIPYLQVQTEKLESDLVLSKDHLATCVKGNETLSEAIDAQNKALADLGGLASKIDNEFQKLNDSVNKIRKDTNKAVKDILNAPTPQTCEEAMQMLRDGVGDIKW